MFGKLFEALDRFVERWLERKRGDGNQTSYRQLAFDWHTLEAAGMGEDE